MNHASNRHRTAIRLIVLLAVGVPVLFFHAGSRGFWPSSEDRTAETVREMIESGDYLILQMGGRPLVTKPPLLHWMIAGSTSLFGVNEFTIRLPSLCFALATAVVLFLVGKRFVPERAVFLATLMLLTTPMLLRVWRAAQIDVLLTLLITSALLSFYAAINRDTKRTGLFVLFFGLIGLAGMAKGPAGMGPPLLVALVYLVGTRQWRVLGRVPWAWGVPLMLVVGFWWYGAMLARVGGFDGLRAITGGDTATYFGWEHEKTGAVVWFYIPRLLVDFFPWSLLVPVALVTAVRTVRQHENPFVGFLLAWVLVYFVVFSLLGKKASRYLVPLYPAAALLVGLVCHAAIEDTLSTGLRRWLRVGVAASAVVCLAVVAVVVLLAADFDYESLYITRRWTESKDRFLLAEISGLLRAHPAPTLLITGALLGAFVAATALWRRRTALAVGLLAAAAAGSNVAFDVGIVPTLDRALSPRYFARHIVELVPAGAPLAGYCEGSEQIDDCTRYYLDRPLRVLTARRELREWATEPPPRYVFMLESDVQQATGVVFEWFELVDSSHTYRGETVYLFRNRSADNQSADTIPADAVFSTDE